MLKFVKTPKYARWIKLGMIGFSILAISLSIVFLVNIITPFGRLTISSPANSFVELIFCIFVSISLILRLNDIMNYKQQVPYKIGLEIIIAAIGILQLIDFICWFINPVSDVLAAIICLFTFLLQVFILGYGFSRELRTTRKYKNQTII